MIHTILELKLAEALMDVCHQRMGETHELNSTIFHDFMSDGERALKLLRDLALAETEDNGVTYKLRYDRLDHIKNLYD